MKLPSVLAAVFVLIAPRIIHSEVISLGLRVLSGFEVTEFADSHLANDIYCLTIDPRGRVVVSGRGYLRILIDDNQDERADRAIDFAEAPADGAMGLLWEGTTLYFTGDGGLRCFHDKNRDDRADGPSELIRRMKTGGEHDSHAVRRGPDGRLYVLCGNSARIDKGFVQLATSPIQDPIAGCVVRFSPDLKQTEVFADGFRNPYDMDFNADGELFTFDSDNERCVSLPWYEPTRFYHVIAGGHYGWRNPQRAEWWRLPPYFADVVPPLVNLGRGSPTAVTCYRHVQFPERYRGGFFLGDWTFGRVYFISMRVVRPEFSKGAVSTDGNRIPEYICEKEVFLEAVGENGFAPTSAAVHPQTGDLYIAIGGRGIRGAVYRVRHRQGFASANRTKNPSPSFRKPGQPPTTTPRFRGFDDSIPATPIDDSTKSIRARLIAVRRLQRSLGDLVSPQVRGTVWEGYTPRLARLESAAVAAALPALRKAFPSGHADLDRELSRTLAMLEDKDPTVAESTLNRLTASSSPVEDVHYLIVFARLGVQGTRRNTGRVASALIALDDKLIRERRNRDRHWPLRIAELLKELCRKDPGLIAAILDHPDFGRPDHALFAQIPGFDRRRAAEIFLAKAENSGDFPWNPSLVELVGSLPEEQAVPVLRRLWDQRGLRPSILPVLARRPVEADRQKYLESLSSPKVETILTCLQALEKLPPSKNGDHLFELVRTLRRLSDRKEERPLKEHLAEYLQRLTGEANRGSSAEAWTEWLTNRHPEFAARLNNADGVNVAAWKARLDQVNWSAGDSTRGKTVFNKAGCASCHSGAAALGPDLLGVAGRFSRDDLFLAIVQPSKDVSPRYQATSIATADGKVFQGNIIYEATDGLILQTGPTATIRIAGDQIADRRTLPTSLMPAGLLDPSSDGDIADLYAFLKGLRVKVLP